MVNPTPMSDESTNIARGFYAGLPILTDDNFADWDMQAIAYLTGSQDHVRGITPTRQADGTYIDPKKPTPANTKATTEFAVVGKGSLLVHIGSLWSDIGLLTSFARVGPLHDILLVTVSFSRVVWVLEKAGVAVPRSSQGLGPVIRCAENIVRWWIWEHQERDLIDTVMPPCLIPTALWLGLREYAGIRGSNRA